MTGSFCRIIKLDYVRIRTQHASPRVPNKLSVVEDDSTIAKNRICLTWHQKKIIIVAVNAVDTGEAQISGSMISMVLFSYQRIG